jgi:hypothetical protein
MIPLHERQFMLFTLVYQMSSLKVKNDLHLLPTT